MTEERRQGTIDSILISIGELTSLVKANGNWLENLADHVKCQNGRVGDLEKWKAYILGINSVVIVLLIPIAIHFVTVWISGK